MIKSNKKTRPPIIMDLQIGPWISFLQRRPAEIAQKIGINEGYLSQLISSEKQNPSYDLVRRLADELGIPIDSLRKPPPDKKTIETVRSLDPAVVKHIRQIRDRSD